MLKSLWIPLIDWLKNTNINNQVSDFMFYSHYHKILNKAMKMEDIIWHTLLKGKVIP